MISYEGVITYATYGTLHGENRTRLEHSSADVKSRQDPLHGKGAHVANLARVWKDFLRFVHGSSIDSEQAVCSRVV